MSHTLILSTTVDAYCKALYGEGVECVNRGTYPGTDIPLRPVPGAATLTVWDTDRGYVVKDDTDGWIAVRVCSGSIGERMLRKLQAALSTHTTQD